MPRHRLYFIHDGIVELAIAIRAFNSIRTNHPPPVGFDASKIRQMLEELNDFVRLTPHA